LLHGLKDIGENRVSVKVSPYVMHKRIPDGENGNWNIEMKLVLGTTVDFPIGAKARAEGSQKFSFFHGPEQAHAPSVIFGLQPVVSGAKAALLPFAEGDG
jgi:hypothetical protein